MLSSTSYLRRVCPAPSLPARRWLSELEAARSSETEGKFRSHGAQLEAHAAALDTLLGKASVCVWVGGHALWMAGQVCGWVVQLGR